MSSPASSRQRSSLRTLVGGLLLLAFVVAATYVVLDSSDRQVDPPQLSGALWRGGSAQIPLLVYITKENRAETLRGIGRIASYRTRPYSRYELVVRRLPDGEVVKVQRLADLRVVSDEKEPGIIGAAGDMLWLWRDSLEGYRLPDLALQVTPRTITARAPATRDMLPGEAKGYRVAANLSALVARGRDARFYRIDGSPPAISVLDPVALPPTSNSIRVEDRFDYLVPPGRSRVITHPYTLMQRHFFTSTGRWFALLSSSEREGLLSWASAEDYPSGDVARTLFGAPYRMDGRGQPEISVAEARPVGTERLIQAGFLVRTARAVWDVSDPSSSLVLGKDRLGEAEPWQVLRLTREGTVLWRTSTGLPTPMAMLDLGTHVAFYGDAPGMPRWRSGVIVWIDERTGASRVLSLATGIVQQSGQTR